MKLTILLFLLLSCIGFSQNNLKTGSIKPTGTMNKSFTTEQQEVIKTTDLLAEMMISRDLEGLNNLLDRGFTLTHITGYVQPKAEWLLEIETERMKYYGIEVVKQEVKTNGDKATFVGQSLINARIWGSHNVWRIQQTMQMEKRKGKWIILSSVAQTF